MEIESQISEDDDDTDDNDDFQDEDKSTIDANGTDRVSLMENIFANIKSYNCHDLAYSELATKQLRTTTTVTSVYHLVNQSSSDLIVSTG